MPDDEDITTDPTPTDPDPIDPVDPTPTEPEPGPEPEPDNTEELRHARAIGLMREAYSSISDMPLAFGIPNYSDDMPDEIVEKQMGHGYKNVLRELGITNLDSINEMSYGELMVKERMVYWMLKKFRLTAATFFKFSTATDGKTIDKQQIPKMLADIISGYEKEWNQWKATSFSTTGQLWNREGDVNTNGDYNNT